MIAPSIRRLFRSWPVTFRRVELKKSGHYRFLDALTLGDDVAPVYPGGTFDLCDRIKYLAINPVSCANNNYRCSRRGWRE